MAPKPQRRSIRFAIVAVVCLLLGAVTTVGVAWAAELHKWPYRSGPITARREWPSWAPPGKATSYLSHTSWTSRVDFWQGAGPSAVLQRSCGWPFLALWRGEIAGSSFDSLDAEPGVEFISRREGVAIIVEHTWAWPWRYCEFETSNGLIHLSVSPLFPGFALDTALYASAWYVVMFTPLPLIRAGRRRFRVSRGMCGSCGYDPKGSKGGPCPECGAEELRHEP